MIQGIPFAQAIEAAEQGSPALLGMFGRAFGLADGETAALKRGNVPGWIWAIVGIGVGASAGVWAYRKWPEKFPSWLIGK